MARMRKPHPKAKAARATRARKVPARKKPSADHNVSSSAASRPRSSKPPPDPLDDFVAAAARVLALPIEPQWLAAIKANLEVNLRLGALVAEFALPDESEPAPVFTA
jgi:hypothetical protein